MRLKFFLFGNQRAELAVNQTGCKWTALVLFSFILWLFTHSKNIGIFLFQMGRYRLPIYFVSEPRIFRFWALINAVVQWYHSNRRAWCSVLLSNCAVTITYSQWPLRIRFRSNKAFYSLPFGVHW
jgi:hypothetical protein